MLTQQSYKSGYLSERDGHSIHYACYGSPSASPILFLHGGPGCGFEAGYLPIFDLSKVNLITFDQRGTGKSKPFGRLEFNTTQKLIEDIELLRCHLNISQWIVTGHSWGTTLGVVYAQQYPESCSSLVLASFFGAKKEDQDWTFSGIKRFFPNEVSQLHALRQEADQGLTLDEWILKNLCSEDDYLAKLTAYHLLRLEEASCKHEQSTVSIDDVTEEILNIYRILFFYAKNSFFIEEEKIYGKALQVPSILVHGQFDMDCTPDQAYRLKSTSPTLDLRIVRGGNHSVFEDPMRTSFARAVSDAVTSLSLAPRFSASPICLQKLDFL